MNLFILNLDLSANAQAHVDRHIVKMPVEAAQQLSTALHLSGVAGPYRPAYQHHPCTRWVASSRASFRWAAHYGLSLCYEYTYRYGKLHACASVIQHCLALLDNSTIPDTVDMPPFVMAMPAQYQSDDVVSAYRNYYRFEKMHLAKWTGRHRPIWLS
jgi:hypothetical protein